MDQNLLEKLSNTIRYWILKSTTNAGSGHPTSSMSAVELMAALIFTGIFKYDVSNIKNPLNDSLIFSKGHASPLYYALWAAAGAINFEELLDLRRFGSRLEGHPTMKFPYTTAPTGSLGQGLSIGLGIALCNKYINRNDSRTYVLLGDGELEEGQVWEAAQLASKYKLNNLICIVDVNRLEQSGETINAWDINTIAKKFDSFGWKSVVIENGHDLNSVYNSYLESQRSIYFPVAIIAKTIKGKGLALWENELNWHSKIIKPDELESTLSKLGVVETKLTSSITKPQNFDQSFNTQLKTTLPENLQFNSEELISTKKVYGKILNNLAQLSNNIVSLDAGVSNSTLALDFALENPDKFFEMYIAEQNMVSAAVGMSTAGVIPFVSTFAAFFSRAYDQIRMAAQSNANIKMVSSYAGVSIGMDGQSQMGLEDISMMRSLQSSIVLYPSDPYAMKGVMELALKNNGLVYIRATRQDTPVIYSDQDEFRLGGFKVFSAGSNAKVSIISAGITVHESLKAQKVLESEGNYVQVIDLYSIKPIDFESLERSLLSKKIIIVEDHFPQGGIGEAVMAGLVNKNFSFKHLAVFKQPMSGKPEELLNYEEIDSVAIISAVKSLL